MYMCINKKETYIYIYTYDCTRLSSGLMAAPSAGEGILHHTMLYCTMLYYDILYCIML